MGRKIGGPFVTLEEYIAEWRKPGWLPRRLRFDAHREVMDRWAYSGPGKFQNTYASAAAAMIVAADHIDRLERLRHRIAAPRTTPATSSSYTTMLAAMGK